MPKTYLFQLTAYLLNGPVFSTFDLYMVKKEGRDKPCEFVAQIAFWGYICVLIKKDNEGRDQYGK